MARDKSEFGFSIPLPVGKKGKICEGCGTELKEDEICFDTVMPVAIGTFRGVLCGRCAFGITSDADLLISILKRRAEQRGIKLPIDFDNKEELDKLLDK